MGFSRTCFHVKYFLTHADSRFAAASVTDGIDASYFQYMVEGNLTVARRFYRAVNGNDPFGEGLKSWMQNSTGFNADKVRTPLLIMALNPASLLFEWEWFAALTILAKPVDMIYMQDGTHILQRPLDRIISQQGNVDWFCFWLKGEEDRDPAKAEQYARWHDLRELAQDKAHSTR